ncbi:zf-HC2 domain-containing protein [Cellulomonas sp. NPDC089187]|uniref:zf-HC2 domain-containing protein n=1 Tax=Cellulomonas sp. NPDC089187 TaxID=3154970 RepID=UPI0034150103
MSAPGGIDRDPLRHLGQDDATLADLWHRHHDAMLATARAITGDQDAEDLLQEAFADLTAMVQAGSALPVSVELFLVDQMTAAHAHRHLPEPPELDPVAPAADQVVAAQADRHHLLTAFRALPENWRTVLWAVEVEGRTASDLGTELGLSPNATAALTYRAREGLRHRWLQTMADADQLPEECRAAAELMPALIRGRLSRSVHSRLERHLDGCVSCTLLLESMREENSRLPVLLLPLLVGMTVLPVTDISEPRATASARRRGTTRRRTPFWTSMGARWAARALPCGALLVGLLVLGALLLAPSDQGTGPTTAATRQATTVDRTTPDTPGSTTPDNPVPPAFTQVAAAWAEAIAGVELDTAPATTGPTTTTPVAPGDPAVPAVPGVPIETRYLTPAVTWSLLDPTADVVLDAERRRVYSTRPESDTVVAVDVDTWRSPPRLHFYGPAASTPGALAVDPATGRLLVGLTGGGASAVAIVDPDTFTVTSTVPMSTVPDTLTVSADGRTAWATEVGSSTLTVLDLTGNPTVSGTRSLPGAVGTLTEDGSVLHATAADGTAVWVLDPATGAVLHTWTGTGIRQVLTLDDGTALIVTATSLDRVQADTGAALASWPVTGASAVDVDPVTGSILIAVPGLDGGSVQVLDRDTWEWKQTVAVPGAQGILVDPDGTHVWLVTAGARPSLLLMSRA